MMGVWLVVCYGCLVSECLATMMGVWLVTRLNDDNLTLDDDFHLATMMGVRLVCS